MEDKCSQCTWKSRINCKVCNQEQHPELYQILEDNYYIIEEAEDNEEIHM